MPGALVELDVVRQQPGTLLAKAGNLGRDRVAPVRGFAELLFQAGHGGKLAAMPFFQAGQCGAHGGVLFGDGRGLAFQRLEFMPLRLQVFFALRARVLLIRHGCAIALALRGRFLSVAAQTVELQPGHAQTGIAA